MLFGPNAGGGGILSYTTAQRGALSPTDGTVIYNTTDKRVQYYDGTATIWRDVGDPLQPNYIKNWTGDTSVTTGWATYADAAGAQPVDGTGGSPNVTFSISSTSPLRGLADFNFVKDAANRQGQGVSYDFTIDSADKARVLQISFDYEIVSGTYADGDVTIWVYDVTNGTLIQPAGTSLLNTTVPTQKQQCTFQTNSNSTSYRLIFHVTSTSASAYTIAFDNYSVAPQGVAAGTPFDPDLAYTPTLTGFGTATGISFSSHREGEYLVVTGKFTCGTTTATEARISLGYAGGNSNVTSASTIPTIQQCGTLALSNSTGNVYYVLIEPSKSYLTIANQNAGALTKANGDAFLASGNTVSFVARVQISGWSPNTVMSTDTSTRVVSMQATGDAASASSGNPIIMPTVQWDTHGAYSNSTGRYTVAVPGFYKIFGYFNGGTAVNFFIYKNAVQGQEVGVSTSSGTVTFSGAVSCVAGDIIDIRPNGTFNAIAGNLNIERLSGPVQIAASETVAAKIGGDPASTSSGNPIIFPTVNYDTHGGYNASTGRYTVPISGLYRVYGQISSTNTAVGLNIYLTASPDSKVGTTDSNGECAFIGAVRVLAGTLIDVRPNNTLDGDATSVLYIERFGNY